MSTQIAGIQTIKAKQPNILKKQIEVYGEVVKGESRFFKQIAHLPGQIEKLTTKKLFIHYNNMLMKKRFLIRLGHSIRLVDIKDVAYFYTKDKIAFLVINIGKRNPVDYSLEKLDEMANPKKFFRISRQFIINIDAIKK